MSSPKRAANGGGPGPDSPPGATNPPSAENARRLSGRVSLSPESQTVDAPDDQAGASGSQPADPRAVGPADPAPIVTGAPPWGNEPVDPDAAPPPWESELWPGRDQEALGSRPSAADQATGAASAAPGGTAPGGRGAYSAPDSTAPGGTGPGRVGNPLATPALAAGIAGFLVLPGIVLGILGLRRARATGTGNVKSWLGIGLSLLWAVGIVIVIVSVGGSASVDPGCADYHAVGRAASTRALAAIGSGVSGSVLRADLRRAVATTNSAAARAQSMNVTNALTVLTDNLQSALAQVNAGTPIPASARAGLSHGAAAAASACSARPT
jgi:hypothetical protein